MHIFNVFGNQNHLSDIVSFCRLDGIEELHENLVIIKQIYCSKKYPLKKAEKKENPKPKTVVLGLYCRSLQTLF